MVRVLKWMGGVLLVMAVLAVGVYGVSRLMGPTKAEREALAVLAPGKPPAGKNGFAQLWLLPYAVPADQQQAVLKQDLTSFAKTPGADGLVSSAEQQWPREHIIETPGLRHCGWSEQDCLLRVRADQAGYAALVASNVPLAARVEALGDADYVRNPFPPGLLMPMPAYQLLVAPQTGHALDFVRGRKQQALAGVCRDAHIARMLEKEPDYLVGSAISLAMYRGAANLFAEMLAELPADAELPEDCQAAFAPFPTDARAVCAVMKREFAYARASLTPEAWQQVEGVGAIQGRWFFDPGKTAARMALRPAWPCQTGGQKQLAADTPITTPAALGQGWNFRCIANAVGCTLSDINALNLDDGSRRIQDGLAQARLLSVALWLRAHPDAKLADLPPELSHGRAFKLDAEHRTLSMPLFVPQNGQERWEIPLPASASKTRR